MKYDFCGYATKANVACADGRTILPNAFKGQNGSRVPLVWQHQRNNPENVLGHAILENREDGVYAYGVFNDTPKAKIAKELLTHGDINAMSIFANKLMQKGNRVMHGEIKEVSLVLAGANPEALIDNVTVEHSDGEIEERENEAIIYSGETMEHSESFEFDNSDDDQEDSNDDVEHTDGQNESENLETIQEVFDTLNDKQKEAVYAIVGTLFSEVEDDENDVDGDDAEHSDEEDENVMKHNIFDDSTTQENNTLTHDEIIDIFKTAQRQGSLRQAVQDACIEHGIENLEILFPEAKAVNTTPEMIMREQEWVAKVWNATRKSPFSRIKSTAADLTKDEARAKGYIKGKKKVEEQFALLKRVTTPTTVYKKQGLDRDDIIDITDFDVVSWLKAEMRLMLNEELARALLVSDGRLISSEDKINEQNIRPIWKDDDMYSIKYPIDMTGKTSNEDRADAIIEGANRARKSYKGSGSPTLYIGSDDLTTMLLAKDKTGRRLYNTINELAAALRVREIVEVPIMEGLTRTVEGDNSTNHNMALIGIIVNLTDYTIGADRGGAVTMFDDFDIDYNKYKYLIETRCSGALTMPYSAIVLEYEVTEAAG